MLVASTEYHLTAGRFTDFWKGLAASLFASLIYLKTRPDGAYALCDVGLI
jgi:hypothetical protein